MKQYLKITCTIAITLTTLACERSDTETTAVQQSTNISTDISADQITETDKTIQENKAPLPLENEGSPLTANRQQPSETSTLTFKNIEWIDLMPKEDLEALMNPPSYIADIEDGSFEDQISNQLQNSISAASDDLYQQALVSTQVIPEMDGQAIRIPGFIVPLTFDDDQTITEFLLVPFFGACIHVPPPPPNQIIYVTYEKGFQLEELYDPFWISGVLKTSLVTSDLATAAYTMDMQIYEPYTE